MTDSNKEKWAFIVNPISGNLFGATMVPVIEKKIIEFGIDGTVAVTERPGHATELARDVAGKGYRFIIAVGGDGTLNEVARALVNNKNVISGIIPAGTGNDFNQIPGFPDRFTDKDWEIFFKKKLCGPGCRICERDDLHERNGSRF